MTSRNKIKRPQIGDNIKRALHKRNKSQTWLAEQLNTTRQHVNAWCQNTTKPNSENLAGIAKALDFAVEEIVTGNFRDEMTRLEEPQVEYHGIIESEKESISNMLDILSDESLSNKKKDAYKRSIMRKIDMVVAIIEEERY